MLCGIDEAGRGPIAGPLVVAGVILKNEVIGLADSKKLSEKKREALFDSITQSSLHHIVIIDAAVIDEKGLSSCMNKALGEIVTHFAGNTFLFDGNCTFGIEDLPTMVKADDRVDEVKAASILAKVTRDRIMKRYDTSYPEYGFKGHKGYGTKRHVEAIKRYGYCPIHRVSFRLKALQATLF